MVSADKFLDILQEKDLLPGDLLRTLRRRVGQSARPVAAAAVAKQLVEMGHLTQALADRLLASAATETAPGPAPDQEEDDLGLAPLPEDVKNLSQNLQRDLRSAVSAGSETHAERGSETGSKKTQPRPAAKPEAEDLGLVPLDEPAARKGPVGKPAAPKGPAGPSELVPLGREGEDSGLAILDDAAAGAKPAERPASGQSPPAKAPQQPAKPQAGKQPAKAQAGSQPAKPQASAGPTKPQTAAKPADQPKPVDQPKPAAGKPSEKPAKPQGPERASKPAAPSAPASSLLDEELVPLETASASPLDTLMATSALDASTASPLAPVMPKKRGFLAGLFGSRPRPGRRKNAWDSPLMLVGGGTLLLFLILGGVLFLTLARESGDKLLDPANQDYSNGSYTQAIYKYNVFLEKFPRHPGASLARVRRGLAQMRQSIEGGGGWPKALETAKQSLDEISPEDDFKEARDDLASILPAIAQGLAKEARSKPSAELVAQAEETLALVDKYVVKSLQNKVLLDEVRASLAVTTRELSREGELDKAIAAMQAALEKADAAAAYEARYALVKQYPDLAANAKLAAVTAEVSKAQKSAVKMVQQEQAAEKGEPPSAIAASVAFARQSGGEAAGGRGRVVLAAFRGAVYALDGASGKLLWRRATGPAATGRGPVLVAAPVSEAPDADVLVVDAARRELVRVESATGRVRWRHAVGQPIEACPVVAKDRVLVATAAGKRGRLGLIDLETGGSPGHVELPQPVRVAPDVDPRRDSIYLVAEHSNLYVLSLADGHAKDVVHLGHEPGGITTPPVHVANLLIVVENREIDKSLLRVLLVESGDQGEVLRPVQEAVLAGHVDTPPLMADRRLAVATDRGAVYLYEISGTNKEQPLSKIAERGAEGRADLVRFPLMAGGQLWVAGDELWRFDVQTAMGRLATKAVDDADAGDIFVQPPVALDDALCHARYKVGLPGVLVSAVELKGGKRVWQTHLGAGPAGEPKAVASPPGLTLTSAAGDVFRLDAAAIRGQTVAGSPVASIEAGQAGATPRPLAHLVYLPDGSAVLSPGEGGDRVFVLGPKAEDRKWAALALPGPLSCAPVPFSDGLLAPCATGQVAAIDPRSGAERMGPFQPPLEPGVVLRWRSPAVLDQKEILIADGDRRLYRVGTREKPKPHLEALATADLPAAIVSPVAVVGSVAYAVDDRGRLVAFALPGLERSEVAALGARCAWGPGRVGSHVLVGAEDGRVLVLDDQKQVSADLAFDYGPLAGTPLEHDGGYLLASKQGVVWQIRPSGEGKWEEAGRVDAGCPLASGPVVLENRLFVAGHDGTLYELALPAATPAAPKPEVAKPAEPKPKPKETNSPSQNLQGDLRSAVSAGSETRAEPGSGIGSKPKESKPKESKPEESKPTESKPAEP